MIPPLRSRREDIPLLVDHFVGRFNERLGTEISGVDPQAMRLLCDYPWPGNVRELEHAMERAMVLCEGTALQPHDFEAKIRERPKRNDSFVLDLTELQKRFLKDEVAAGGIGLVLSFMKEPGNKLWAAFFSYHECVESDWTVELQEHQLLTNGKREVELVNAFKAALGADLV